jgi:hypothetical protein
MRPREGLVVDRRAFMSTLAGGLLAAPLAAVAQRVHGFPLGAIEDTQTRSHREMF